MAWIGGDLKDYVSNPLPWIGTHCTRPDWWELHPTRPWTLPGMEPMPVRHHHLPSEECLPNIWSKPILWVWIHSLLSCYSRIVSLHLSCRLTSLVGRLQLGHTETFSSGWTISILSRYRNIEFKGLEVGENWIQLSVKVLMFLQYGVLDTNIQSEACSSIKSLICAIFRCSFTLNLSTSNTGN